MRLNQDQASAMHGGVAGFVCFACLNRIADYALLGDCHSAALVSREGSVEWLCFPRFDSPSVFGRLLDDDAGHWSIRPVGDFEAARRYVDKTMVLETTFTTDSGSVTVIDALAMGANERGHDIGGEAPGLLLRQVQGVTGHVELEMEFALRTEYGLIYPLLSPVKGGVRGGADRTRLPSRHRSTWRSAPSAPSGASAPQPATASRSGSTTARSARVRRSAGSNCPSLSMNAT